MYHLIVVRCIIFQRYQAYGNEARTLSRWTKGNYDRVYINGGSRAGDGFVDLKNRVACLRGELSYQTKIADMILAMEF